MIYKGKVENRKLKIADRDVMLRDIEALDGQDVVVSIKAGKPTRSNRQNNYYWGVVLQMLADHTGHTPEELHEMMRQKFLSQEGMLADEQVKYSISTSKLNTSEMETYLAKVRQWALIKLDAPIPEPNENLNYFNEL